VPETNDTAMTATRCSLFVLSKGEELDRAFCYRDLNGLFTYGTLRNVICSLRRNGKILKFPKENPARFILTKWKTRPEYMTVFKNYRDPMGVGLTKRVKPCFDFVRVIESLGWEDLPYLHNIRLEFNVFRADGVSSSDGWQWCKRSFSYRKRFYCFEFPLFVQLYDSGRVQVLVKCSMAPVPFCFSGLTSLTSVLGELKGKLDWVGAPRVVDWVVTSWHYGKDSVKEVSGASFNVTFQTWSNTFARIYVKRELRKVRVEEIQSPNRTVQELFETVMNRGSPAFLEKRELDKDG